MYLFPSLLSKEAFLTARHPLAKSFLQSLERMWRQSDAPLKPLSERAFLRFERDGERLGYEKQYFARRRRLLGAMLNVWLFAREEDVHALSRCLEAVLCERTWALPAHLCSVPREKQPFVIDLFNAETAHTLAETLSLCGDRLDEELKIRCRDAVFSRVLIPFEERVCDFERLHNNWAAVCGGAVGMAAIYLIEDDERLFPLLARCKSSCLNFLDSCTADGACLEGLGYFNYAMQYFTAFDDLLKKRTGRAITEAWEKQRLVSSFPALCCLNGARTVTFSDSTNADFCFGIMGRLHKKFGVPIPPPALYKRLTDECARTAGAVRNIAWFDESLLSAAPVPPLGYFPDGQWAILRRGKDALAAKGGHNDEPHNHNDVGSLEYLKGGALFLDDLGAPAYTRDYFAENRYKIINASSAGHSVPVVNGYLQCAGREFCADEFTLDDGIFISFSNAYDRRAGLKKLERKIYFDGTLNVIDRFVFENGQNTVTERLITRMTPERISDGEVLLHARKKSAAIRMSEGGVLTVTPCTFLSHRGANKRTFYMIDCTYSVQREATLSFTVT